MMFFKPVISYLIVSVSAPITVRAQPKDLRQIVRGYSIYESGYTDQSYIIVSSEAESNYYAGNK